MDATRQESTPGRELSELPGVADAVSAARTVLATLHRHPANRRDWGRIAAAASVRAARASAAMDGGDAAIDSERDRIDDPVLAGAVRASSAVASLTAVWERSPLQALARLHVLAAADLVDDADRLGRPVRNADRLGRLAGLVTATRWPAPVLIAVVHGELLTARPFGTADGVVARAAARLAAVATGLDPHGLGVPEVAHLRAGERYLQLADGYRAGTESGVSAWIVATCEWLQAGAREGGSIADAAL